MTKAERLVYLINLIRNRGPVLVNKMADECAVSARTIYRDMNSLMRLNMPIYYNNGYRLARDIGFPFGGLNAEEVELIGYSIRHNPLSKHPFFRRRFHVIEQKIQGKVIKTREERPGSLFLFEKTHESIEKSRDSEIIARFLQAIYERRKVLVSLTDGHTQGSIYIPLAVRLGPTHSYLVVATEAELLVEEPISNVESIKLTDEKFTSRPLHLLRREALTQKGVD
jgi:predicted DNA-binding transcriptional regulator YafY